MSTATTFDLSSLPAMTRTVAGREHITTPELMHLADTRTLRVVYRTGAGMGIVIKASWNTLAKQFELSAYPVTTRMAGVTTHHTQHEEIITTLSATRFSAKKLQSMMRFPLIWSWMIPENVENMLNHVR